MSQSDSRFHQVRNNNTDHFRRTHYAPNNKFRAQYLNSRNCTQRDYQENWGMVEVRYCDNGYHGDSAPSLTYSTRIFFPQWAVC